MPRAYPTDLRERALAAYEAGEGRQPEIASAYRIGERTLSGWLKLAREEGRRSPKPRRGGARPVGGEAATLAALVAERNDATLAEYADRLAERAGVRRSPSALCRALKALGLVRKKRRSCRGVGRNSAAWSLAGMVGPIRRRGQARPGPGRGSASRRPCRVIWPDASNAQNSIAAVSAQGRTHCVLMRRLNSSCRRSMAFVVRNERHCSGG